LFLAALAPDLPAATTRERPLNANWCFVRGDAPDAQKPEFNDAAWRQVNLPHDWSIEDLPARGYDPLFAPVTLAPGSWKFAPGDDEARSRPAFNDTAWQTVTLPETWDKHGQAGSDSVYGWYRRRFSVPAGAAGKTVLVELGVINGQNWTYVDGVKVQETGTGYWSNNSILTRTVALPPDLTAPGEHVIAIRIKGPRGGGFIAAVAPPGGPSPVDPGRSAGNINTGYAVGGIGWYRQHFVLPAADAGKQVRVVFDGSYLDTTVWLNGLEVGAHHYGYSPFGLDLTPQLKPAGQVNVLAVKVVNQGSNSRWYSGSGLFRPVHLEITQPLRVAPWGLAVTTPLATAAQAQVAVHVDLLNAGPETAAKVRVRLLNSGGKIVATGEAACQVPGTGSAANLTLSLAKPSLWSPGAPALYRAEVTVLASGKTVDETVTTFGIRSLAWNAERGFLLNGKPIKLRGGCVHHDHGPLGSASFADAEERRVARLQAAGYNAIRCSHNPPAASFLEACDRAGMLVIDEAFDMWNQSKTPQDYARFFKTDWQTDLDAMVRRDRNHPCVVMWSIGNEIPERFDASGATTAKTLADYIRAVDSSRPVTAAFNNVSEKADPFFSALDICGYNYCPDRFAPDHQRQPQRVLCTTESYPRDSFTYWSRVQQFPYVVGDFVWTAWDYRGESAIGHTIPEGETSSGLLGWPNHNAFCGDFDVCGFVKPQGLYRQVLWDARRAAILVESLPPGQHSRPDYWGWRDELPTWTWPGLEGKTRTVRVYAKGDRVRLTLNGKEVGVRDLAPQLTATFEVVYAPGELSAEILKAGKVVAKDQLITAGPAAALKLTVEKPSLSRGADHLAFVAIEAVDAHGVVVPTAAQTVRISVEGPGALAGFGNGDPQNVASVQQPEQALWRGRALLILRGSDESGEITVTAESGGLKTGHTLVRAR